MHATRQQVLGYRLEKQGFERSASQAEDLAILDIGVQDSGAESARLAFDARLTKVPAVDLAGPDRPLALAWTLRAAPYFHRRKDLDALGGALWPLSDADAGKRLGETAARMKQANKPGVEAFGEAVRIMREVVKSPMGKGAASTALTKALPPWYSRYCRGCQTTHVSELVMRLSALPAGIELEPGTAPPVLVPRRRAARVTRLDEAVLRRLILSYLTILGPATEAEVSGYLEARRTDVAKIWPADDLAEVDVDGKPGWLPKDQVGLLKRAKPMRVARLLGPFDPWLQARDRDLIVPDKAAHKPLWPVLGRPGVVMVDGEVVGIWRPKSSGKKLRLTVDEFVPIPQPIWKKLDAEAERVAQVRGATDVELAR